MGDLGTAKLLRGKLNVSPGGVYVQTVILTCNLELNSSANNIYIIILGVY